MGIQNRYARMPLPPATIAPRDIPLWDTRAQMMAADRRKYRADMEHISGAMLTRVLDTLRPLTATSRDAVTYYRQALHEAVVGRHWTVEWSALDNRHKIY